MMTINENSGLDTPRKIPLNIAIVGGGRACKFFLELLKSNSFPYLDIHIVGVCDIKPEAVGLKMAKDMDIFTTSDFKDFFKFKNLDSIIELTNSREVLLDLVKSRPKGVGVVEHNIGRFFRSFYLLEERLKSAEYQVNIEKLVTSFLIKESNAAIVVLNTDYTIVDANDAYLKIIKKRLEEAVGAYCYEVYYQLKAPCSISRPALKCPMLETLKTGKTAHVIHEFPDRQNMATYGNIVTYPIKDQNGEITKVMEIWRDVTEEISSQLEKRSRELKADMNKMVQEDRMISLGKLAASCVHEINNPIQGLLTFTDLMKDILTQGSPTTEDLKQFNHYLSLMSGELERCGNIVSGLLSFSRETSLEYKNVNIRDVIEAVITLTRHKMELQNIELEVDFAPGMNLIRGDANRLQQALLNLIFNAIEAMPDGGWLRILSRLDETQKELIVEIEDTGQGIPQEHLDNLYDPFFTTKEEGEGTGLGLSIVYGVVKNHGGKIKASSIVGKGTKFTIRFPVT
jgi:signal transduction histidine kinase